MTRDRYVHLYVPRRRARRHARVIEAAKVVGLFVYFVVMLAALYVFVVAVAAMRDVL